MAARGAVPALAVLCVALLPAASEYERRVNVVRSTPGFVALWDFVLRETGGGRFVAHQSRGEGRDFALDAVNYVREYWGEGRAATYADFPLLGRGPFGQAVEFRAEQEGSFRPTLLVPRERVHGSRLDVKGWGASVSLVAWVVRAAGNHAIAGIWHEGTDLKQEGVIPAARVELGRRQYALFAGLAANDGAAAAHVSENGGKSFGDRYARNLAVTREVIPLVSASGSEAALDGAWTAVGFVFDNARDTVTAYFNGKADEFWVENPDKHPFFQWPAKAWRQAQLRDDPAFPKDQYYAPPEGRVRRREVVRTDPDERVELLTFEFTKVRVTLRRDARGRFREVVKRELQALCVNPFWFGHDLYSPVSASDGGPFTIGRVIHSSRGLGFRGFIGGVAVFDRALSPRQMARVMRVAEKGPIRAGGR